MYVFMTFHHFKKEKYERKYNEISFQEFIYLF